MAHAHLTGPMEARLVALERKCVRLDDEIRQLAREGIALGQGIWDSWGGEALPIGVPSPPPAGVLAFPHICVDPIPFDLVVHDSAYGDTTISWDGTARWVGCKLASYPGSLICGAAGMTPVTYTLFGDDTTASWFLRVAWKSHVVGPGNVCPSLAATCGTTPDQTFDDRAAFQCHGTTTWGRSAGNLYSGSATWTITIP